MRLNSIITVFGALASLANAGFVKVGSDGNFVENRKRYVVWGANYWQAMNLGASKTGDRARLVSDLKTMKTLNINNLRIIAGSEGSETPQKPLNVLMEEPGVYNEDMFEGLDFALYQMKKVGMKAVMVLNNFWQWSGGFAQYVAWNKNATIPLPPGYPENDPLAQSSWDDFINFSAEFYTCEQCNKWWRDHIKTVINRRNKFTGVRYKDDDTIFSWEFANEPRQNNDGSRPMTDEFIESTAKYIKSLDRNHMVTLGSEAHPMFGKDVFLRENNHKDLDYTTTHIWVQNWNEYDPKNKTAENLQHAIDFCVNHLRDTAGWALKINKPIVFEEYGMARDGWDGQDEYDPATPATNRLKYYRAILDEVYKLTDKKIFQGQNFWAYSGKGRPAAGEHRDLYLGDPAHEHPGWYGIYDKDKDMLSYLKTMGKKFRKLGN